MGLKWLLPSVYYLTLTQLVKMSTEAGEPASCHIDSAGMEKLAPADRAHITLGAINVFHGSSFILDGVRNALFTPCATRGSCSANKMAAFQHIMEGFSMEPLACLVGDEFWKSFKEDQCAACSVAVRAAWELKRGQLWKGLPMMFGLEPWENLAIQRANYAFGIAIATEENFVM